MTNALYLYGGWPGHRPYDIAEWTRDLVGELGFDLEESQDIFTLDRDLSGYDLIILGWNNALTTEDLSDSQEDHLLAAVEAGTGIAAWHGAAAAFRSSLRYHLMLGGDFLAHPAGEGYPYSYEVNVTDRDHPVSHGVNDFSVASEQYYMSVDPNNTVLAETTFTGEHFAWLDGTKSPVAWVRQWGDGRVFYHSIGHAPQDLAGDDVRRLTKQGIAWAARK
jgi:type 1 glutamine amidotransferase